MIGTDPQSVPSPRARPWVIFLLACGASFLLYLHRYSWNIVGPSLRKALGFSNRQEGFLFSLFYYTYTSTRFRAGC